MNKSTSRRAFLQRSALATTGLAFLSAPLAQAFNTQGIPYEGYNPFAEETTDLRKNIFGDYLKVSGKILDHETLLPLPSAKVEVWHLSPNSNKFRHQAKFYTDEAGDYTFLTDIPNKEYGKSKRIYFKITHQQKTYFTELILTEAGSYITSKHWEENQVLGDQLFPEQTKFLNETSVRFHIAMKS